MTVLTFPSSPIIGQRYNAPNEIQYVFDGVKWIVETVATTSAAVTNAVQDRVAPMFVNGPNTGITFAYNAATNVMNASITALNGNQLVNGAQTLTLESNGNITAPAFTIPNTAGTSGQVLKWPSSGTTLAWGSDNNTTDRLTNGLKEVVLDASGALAYPNSALQRDTGTVSCPGTASTVVYTGSAPNQQTIKLLIQVEGSAPGDPYDTQACEMIIAKSFRANALAASVYGVVHTSVAPLATFTANWNALASRVEVLCTTPNANTVNVRIFATEITTSD